MGWASAGAIFDPVARKLIELGAPDDLKTEVLAILIGELEDWDTRDESLEQFEDDEAIVEAFRRHGTVIGCRATGTVQDVRVWCVKERGHLDGGSVHTDYCGREWN
jgi:hypothetical protein